MENGANTSLTGKRPIEAKGISLGPEQDRIVKAGSWMGSGRSDSFAIAAKILLRKQRISLDEVVDGSKNIQISDWRVDIGGLDVEDNVRSTPRNIKAMIPIVLS